MAYMKKVIKGLEYHLKELSIGKTCFECPYRGDNPCEIQLIADALAMLKEQKRQLDEYHKTDMFLATHGWWGDNPPCDIPTAVDLD